METFDGNKYWENRYAKGGNSGSGSYGKLADFKAEVINKFVKEHDIRTVIELGCGDGEQLKKYDTFGSYIGFDVSDSVIELCREKFIGRSKFYKFLNYSMLDERDYSADLSISIDVLFHITNEHEYLNYIQELFFSSAKYVIIYAYDHDTVPEDKFQSHYQPRKFTEYIQDFITNFKLIQHIPNKYPVSEFGTAKGSYSEFYIYERID